MAIASAVSDEPVRALSGDEQRIVSTISELVPSAARSYRQALDDLTAAGRISYRGTAAELREALREIIDHLAPDEAVENEPSFRLEDGMTHPTMRQKVRFVLRSRGLAKRKTEPAEKLTEKVDEITASLFRSIYVHASQNTHASPTLDEVRRLKRYVDTVLTDLLEI